MKKNLAALVFSLSLALAFFFVPTSGSSLYADISNLPTLTVTAESSTPIPTNCSIEQDITFNCELEWNGVTGGDLTWQATVSGNDAPIVSEPKSITTTTTSDSFTITTTELNEKFSNTTYTYLVTITATLKYATDKTASGDFQFTINGDDGNILFPIATYSSRENDNLSGIIEDNIITYSSITTIYASLLGITPTEIIWYSKSVDAIKYKTSKSLILDLPLSEYDGKSIEIWAKFKYNGNDFATDKQTITVSGLIANTQLFKLKTEATNNTAQTGLGAYNIFVYYSGNMLDQSYSGKIKWSYRHASELNSAYTEISNSNVLYFAPLIGGKYTIKMDITLSGVHGITSYTVTQDISVTQQWTATTYVIVTCVGLVVLFVISLIVAIIINRKNERIW